VTSCFRNATSFPAETSFDKGSSGYWGSCAVRRELGTVQKKRGLAPQSGNWLTRGPTARVHLVMPYNPMLFRGVGRKRTSPVFTLITAQWNPSASDMCQKNRAPWINEPRNRKSLAFIYIYSSKHKIFLGN
jgi:hypothetical protein